MSVDIGGRVEKLTRYGPDRHDDTAVAIVTQAHNEANILPAFLDHYRSICRPSFLVVDDRSTDDTPAILSDAPDVTVFRPVAGSTFRTDRAAWRSQIMDELCDGRWCLVPDIDEHFVFDGPGGSDLAGFIAALEQEGAEAVVTLMVDMYRDAPLRAHSYSGEGALRDAFPLFDGQAPAPGGYCLRRLSRREAKAWPTPPVRLSGGMQQRLFSGDPRRLPVWQRALIERFNRLDRPINPSFGRRFVDRLAQKATRPALRGGLNMTKLGLLRWRRGMSFSGGPHKIDGTLPVSEAIAAFLHFPFTRGAEGMAYLVERGQHVDGAAAYRSALDRADLMERSPVWPGTRRYEGPSSLAGLIRGSPGRR